MVLTMMKGLKSIRQERASLERDRVVFGSMVESAQISDAFAALADNVSESTSDEEIEELINNIPLSDEEDEQVERILKSSEDMDVDAILGVDADSEISNLED